MWADDIHWLPRVLRGEKLRGTVYFNTDGATIKDMEWKIADLSGQDADNRGRNRD
jgi:hypothetical protein